MRNLETSSDSHNIAISERSCWAQSVLACDSVLLSPKATQMEPRDKALTPACDRPVTIHSLRQRPLISETTTAPSRDGYWKKSWRPLLYVCVFLSVLFPVFIGGQLRVSTGYRGLTLCAAMGSRTKYLVPK